jgi:hypothetical protein
VTSARIAAFLLELSIVATLVGAIAGGLLAEDERPVPPISLGWRELALLALVTAAGLRCVGRWSRWRYTVMLVLGVSAAAALHPPPEVPRALAALTGALTGGFFQLLGLDLSGLRDEATRRARFRLGLLASILGTLPCSLTWGVLLGAPTSLLGVWLLVETSFIPARDDAALPLWQRVAGAAIATLTLPLLAVAASISLGWILVPMPS